MRYCCLKMLDRWSSNVLVIIIAGVFTLPPLGAHQLRECPGQDVSEVRGQANEHELSLIFYYVAWCSESRVARAVFEEVADLYTEEAHFAKVDCYHLACNCSKTHPYAAGSGAPHKWPTLIIQYGHRISLQYNGEWQAASMVRLIDQLLRPVERVHSREELKVISMRSDAVVLGLFVDHTAVKYRRFVSAAIKWLETDTEHSFQFAAAFGPAAAEILGGTNATSRSPPLLLLVSNRGIEQAPTSEWNVSGIVLWVQAQFRRSFDQLHAYNSPKSLAAQLSNGPVLGIAANDYFFDYMFNLTNPERNEQFACASCLSASATHDYALWQQTEYVKRTLEQHNKAHPRQSHAKEYSTAWHLRHYYGLNEYLKDSLCALSPSCSIHIVDARSSLNLRDLHQRRQCFANAHLGHRKPATKITVAKYLKKFVDNQWHEFRSDHNRSLSICIFEGTKHVDFLELQGISAPNSLPDSVALFIIDPNTESTYVLENQFRYDTLEKFIRNYYGNNLLATLKSTNSHSGMRPPLAMHKRYINSHNRQMFLNTVTFQNTTTVVLLYSPQCIFSAQLSQALSQLASMLDTTAGIDIIRLNVQTDELSWEFAMATIPALIVFPRGRAMDSRMFPMHLRPDTRNIFGFILAQMEPADQIKAVLSSCRRREAQPLRLRKCLQYAKDLTTQHISSHLKLWQNFENQRQNIRERLKELNFITFEMKRSFSNL